MTLHKARIKEFETVFDSEVIDLDALRRLAFNGVPDEKGFRSLVWKLLLHYLPADRAMRESTLQKKRQLYKQFIDEIIVAPGGESDHPLNVSPESSWDAYFKDNEVLLQIDKDVRRLCPDMSFFQSATDFPCEQVVNSSGQKRLHKRVEQSVLRYSTVERQGLGLTKMTDDKLKRGDSSDYGDYAPLPEGCEAHWEVVERMLFLYAKLNPGQGYVQGMNEIIGPIYHTFAIDPDRSYREHAEADCFFCFTNLMSEIRDFFIRTLDEAEGGINYMMEKLSECVKKNDLQIWQRLEQQELRPQYYSFRWLTLLLSQEFPLPEVERIWDSLFADVYRFDFLIHICCAMILLLKDDLMNGDFATNVKMLQNFPSMDVSKILQKAIQIAGR